MNNLTLLWSIINHNTEKKWAQVNYPNKTKLPAMHSHTTGKGILPRPPHYELRVRYQSGTTSSPHKSRQCYHLQRDGGASKQCSVPEPLVAVWSAVTGLGGSVSVAAWTGRGADEQDATLFPDSWVVPNFKIVDRIESMMVVADLMWKANVCVRMTTINLLRRSLCFDCLCFGLFCCKKFKWTRHFDLLTELLSLSSPLKIWLLHKRQFSLR